MQDYFFYEESYTYRCKCCQETIVLQKLLSNFDQEACRFIFNRHSCGGELVFESFSGKGKLTGDTNIPLAVKADGSSFSLAN